MKKRIMTVDDWMAVFDIGAQFMQGTIDRTECAKRLQKIDGSLITKLVPAWAASAMSPLNILELEQLLSEFVKDKRC